ncbi:hypothetical protein EDC04DRAFT_2605323 [Pisolithus marmoratus]|nr:hypothetical protein EDC04DRAFT_2605323 [Pisolithus marmoratus]
MAAKMHLRNSTECLMLILNLHLAGNLGVKGEDKPSNPSPLLIGPCIAEKSIEVVTAESPTMALRNTSIEASACPTSPLFHDTVVYICPRIYCLGNYCKCGKHAVNTYSTASLASVSRKSAKIVLDDKHHYYPDSSNIEVILKSKS